MGSTVFVALYFVGLCLSVAAWFYGKDLIERGKLSPYDAGFLVAVAGFAVFPVLNVFVGGVGVLLCLSAGYKSPTNGKPRS